MQCKKIHAKYAMAIFCVLGIYVVNCSEQSCNSILHKMITLLLLLHI